MPAVAQEDGAHGEPRDKDVVKKRLVKRFYEKGPRAFVVQTVSKLVVSPFPVLHEILQGEKERVFITDRDDIRARWMEELDKVKPRTS